MYNGGDRKRKRFDTNNNVNGYYNDSRNADTAKPTAHFQPGRGRPYTVSVALPGSIVANAQTHDAKTALAGQIARAATVFSVDEIVIFTDGSPAPRSPSSNLTYKTHSRLSAEQQAKIAEQDAKSGYTAYSDPGQFLYHVLSYLECPPYLRKALFPFHPNLKTAGALPSLDAPHHLRDWEWCRYREGVSEGAVKGDEVKVSHGGDAESGKKSKKKKRQSDVVMQSYVNVGLPAPVKVPGEIPENSRVTLKFASEEPIETSEDLYGEAVSPDVPREEAGYYWGYSVRPASSLSTVFTECPYDDGYDFSVGTSERGTPLKELGAAKGVQVPKWKHLLVVLGGLAGLEKAVVSDNELSSRGVRDPSEMFDAYVNLVEGQGSKTIRTEEALWIGLMGLKQMVDNNGQE